MAPAARLKASKAEEKGAAVPTTGLMGGGWQAAIAGRLATAVEQLGRLCTTGGCSSGTTTTGNSWTEQALGPQQELTPVPSAADPAAAAVARGFSPDVVLQRYPGGWLYPTSLEMRAFPVASFMGRVTYNLVEGEFRRWLAKHIAEQGAAPSGREMNRRQQWAHAKYYGGVGALALAAVAVTAGVIAKAVKSRD